MSTPTCVIGTLCLNEMEWLPRLYEQHKDWPGLLKWVFVEGCDPEYARANPEWVLPGSGLSTDGTTDFLLDLSRTDARVDFFPAGSAPGGGGEPDKHKRRLRQAYVEAAHELKPDFLIVLDADEFYTKDHQLALVERLACYPDEIVSWSFTKREIWHPPSLANEPLLGYEVRGGFWGIPCCHWWRYDPSLVYDVCHNTPTIRGRPGNERIVFVDDGAQMVHLGYAASKDARGAKHRYYAGRGEATDPTRKWYVASRAAWFDWKPGNQLPKGAYVAPYTGPVPEVFRNPTESPRFGPAPEVFRDQAHQEK